MTGGGHRMAHRGLLLSPARCQRVKAVQNCLILSNMDRFVSIGEAAHVLGVSITTLRRWEREGKLVPEHTQGGHRRYDLAQLCPERFRASPASLGKPWRMPASPATRPERRSSGKSGCWNCTVHGRGGRLRWWPTLGRG